MTLPNEVNPLLRVAASTAYTINNSLRFRSSASAYLSKTFAGGPASTTIQTFSFWVKRGALGTVQVIISGYDGTSFSASYLYFDTDNTLALDLAGAALNIQKTTAVFRDPSAWYHIVLKLDTTNATAANRAIVYVNGVQQTLSGTTVSGAGQFLRANANNKIATYWSNASSFFDGYMAEINVIDGQALTPSSFGAYSTNGVWQPARYTGAYGTNGFYLKFASFGTAAALGNDSSGNGNTWTVNNISVTAGVTYDPMLDSPTLTSVTVANYAVLNPLVKRWSVASETFSNGNLTVTNAGVSNDYALGTTFVSSGQYYWEVTATTVSGSFAIGVDNGQLQNSVSTNTVFYNNDGTKSVAGTGTSYGSTYTSADVIGVALDKNANTVTFYKNNTSQGSISLPVATVPMGAAISPGSSGGIANINFGQRPFAYTPPSGYVALNAYNLPTPTIANGATVMAATTYTGNSSTQTISNGTNTTTNVTFQPNLVWVKDRTSGANSHNLSDSIRGATNGLASNLTAAEYSIAAFASFTASGFSLSTGSGVGQVNTTGDNYIAWQWLAGASSGSNTSGSITSTVSVNATAGFSVVTLTTQSTGTATVGHGLNAVPSLIITKARAAVSNWVTYHASLGNTGYVYLSTTGAFVVDATIWNNTTPTSTVITLGSGFAGSFSQVFYCWSAVAGYSAFGSYTGNGSTDGPFVYTGFRPRWIMIKRTDTTANWRILDTSRDTYNVESAELYPNLSNAESAFASLDGLSNGFKIRNTDTAYNASGGTYIYAAFAENPFRYSLAR